MKMLFFSADKSEVENVKQEFALAGIPSEIRTGIPRRGAPRDVELWIKNEQDCHRAFTLCVQLGIGFAKRPTRAGDAD